MNTLHGEVIHNNRRTHGEPAKDHTRRLARTGGTKEVQPKDKVKPKKGRQKQTAVTRTGGSRRKRSTTRKRVNGKEGVVVRLKMEYAPGYSTVRPVTNAHGEPILCPKAAFSQPPSRQHIPRQPKIPIVVPVQVPNLCTIMVRIGSTQIPGKGSITIPGTKLVMQVERVIAATTEALVISPEGANDDTILDSGATEHISPKVAGVLTPAPISSIHGLSGTGTPVKGMGTVNQVRNVMCCPGTTRRLLSVGRLLEQLGGKVVFTLKGAYHVAGGLTTTLATRRGAGLYKVSNGQFILNSPGTALPVIGNSIGTDLARERITAVHRVFGHPSKEVIRTVIKQHRFPGVTEHHLQLLQPCNACMLGKARKSGKTRLTAEKATVFGYRLCADCSGPFRTISIGGAKYLLVVVDEFTAWTWVAPVSTLAIVDEKLTHIIEVRLHQRDDTLVKVLRSDGGTEFVNQRVNALLARHGIEREVTCANTSYQNGKAERRIRTVFERVRTCLSDAGLPAGFWAEAAVYVAYTLNRTPPAGGSSPFYMRYGRHPRVSHMRPFGNPCVIYRERKVAGKVQDAGIPGTFLGYGYIDGKNGARVRTGNTNKVATVRDVVCGIFPSASAQVEPLLITGPTEEQTNAVVPREQPRTQPRPQRGRVDQVAVPLQENASPDYTITNLDNAQEVEAIQRMNVVNHGEAGIPDATATNTAVRHQRGTYFTVGAQVEGNWRGHGEYYDAVVTGVHTAGRRVTYDLTYTDDNESEPGISADMVRTRRAPTRSESTGLCGHALMTDCHPAYIAHVPDMARAHITPKHYGAAMASKDKVRWLGAIFDELKTIKEQKVYEFCATLPDGVKALGCLWVFKVKCGPDGKVSRFKARITVNGKTQVYGINYSETFAPVAFATTIRLLLALSLVSNLKLRQFDIKCAFLYATLPKNEQVYMRAPPGFGKRGY